MVHMNEYNHCKCSDALTIELFLDAGQLGVAAIHWLQSFVLKGVRV
jgi:hypothetical protein